MKSNHMPWSWTITIVLSLTSQVLAQYFSLQTPKIYSPGEKVIINLATQDVSGSIFFRAYRIDDPMAFFQRQSDPHSPQQLLSVRESNAIDILRSGRNRLRRDQRQVFRDNMHPQTRTAVKNTLGLETFSLEDIARRWLSPLKNYPLLTTWEVTEFEKPDEYSYRDVEVDLNDPGVYLIEAFNEKLLAHTAVGISRLGLITKSSPEGVLVFACNKSSGEPAKDVNLRIVQDRKEIVTAATDKNGLAQFSVPESENSALLVLGQKDKDFVISDPYYYGFGETRQFVVHSYTERPIYRPQQAVYFKGMVRVASNEGYEVYGKQAVEVRITDPQGTEVYRQRLTTNENGAFSGELALSEEPPLGTYQLLTSIPEKITHYATFKVEEYKKPEFKVVVTSDKDRYSNGDAITATIQADYFFGSPVANAQVDYYIFRGRYYRPWWYGSEYAWYYEDEDSGEDYSYRAELVESQTDYLDENGRHELSYETPAAEEDYFYRIEARVVDASRRQIIGSKQVVVTRGLFMISMYPGKYVYAPGENVTVNIRTQDFGNQPVSQKIQATVYAREWVSEKGWQNKSKLGEYDLTTDAQGQGKLEFKASESGYYYVVAAAKDERGNRIDDEAYVWVSSGAGYFGYEPSGIEIISDKPSYRKGETAHLMVISPVKNVWALVTSEAQGLLSHRIAHIKGTSEVIDVEIEDEHQPNFSFNVALLANDELYTGDENIIVIPEDKFVNVTIRSNKEVYKPQEEGELEIKVTDQSGEGIKAELSVGIVDESIYSLAADLTRDIKKVFYGRRHTRVATHSSVYFSFYGYARGLGASMAALDEHLFSPRRFADVKADKFKEARVRKDFRDTMFWQAHVRTGSDGIARVKIRFPDNLTTWRVTARAISLDTQVGEAIYKMLVRQDLIVRLETPRFLIDGDQVTLSTIAHNYLKDQKQAKISLAGEGAQIQPQTEKQLSLPHNGERRVDWNVSATSPGTASFTAKALTNEVSDAMQLKIPILPHGLKQTEATVVDIDAENAVKEVTITIPAEADPKTAQLLVLASPSIASSMLSALEELAGYPYGCVEQTMSRFLPTAIVSYTAKKLNLDLRMELTNELPKMIDKGLRALYRYQHGDGGWGWWEDDETHPYMTAYVVYGLSLAKQAGYEISGEALSRGATSLAGMLTQAKLSEKVVTGLGEGNGSFEYLDATTQAYMLYALQSAQKAGVQVEFAFDAKLDKLLKEKVNDYAKALLALVSQYQNKQQLASKLATELENSCVEAGAMCTWGGKSWHYNWQDDNLETTAYAVKTLVQVKSESAMIASGIRYLLTQKRGEAWRSTKDSAVIIFALVDFLEKSRELDPNYQVKIYLNDELVFDKRMTKTEALQPEQEIRLNGSRLRSGDNRIRIEKNGPGRFYSTMRTSYYVGGENLQASTTGFGVKREYFKLSRQAVRGGFHFAKSAVNGSVRSGDEILVKVTVSSNADFEYFMLEDPLPAGAEVIRDERGYTIFGEPAYSAREEYEYEYEDNSAWYAAKEVRDEKVAFFATQLPAGKHTFTYLLRAQIPGNYHVMPTLASLMYYPEYQGNGSEMRLEITE